MEQQGILYVARFSFRFDGKIIVIDKQKLRVQHDQTSFIRNVKEISLSKKKKKTLKYNYYKRVTFSTYLQYVIEMRKIK